MPRVGAVSTASTILVVAHAWFGDMVGGSFRLATELAQFLAANGHDVVYACCNVAPDRHLPARERVDGVEVRRYAMPRGPVITRMASHVWRAARLARAVQRERRVAAVSGHSPLQFMGAALALKGSGASINVAVHSPFDEELVANNRRGSFGAAVARFIEHRNLSLAQTFQTDSRFTLQLMTQKHGRRAGAKGVTIPGWVDTRRFRPVADRNLARQSLARAWASDCPTFFTLRRLEPRMGIETLIEASAIVRERCANFQVMIGGGGSLEEALGAMIRAKNLGEHVHLLGRIPEEALATCYGAADCFILPTRALECFGIIVLEAFASGTPVIASRVGAIPEIASVQGDEWLFTPGDAHELADRMEKFLLAKLPRQIDLPRVAREYDARRILPQWQQVLLDDLNRSSRAVTPRS